MSSKTIKILEVDQVPKELVIGHKYSMTWSNNPHLVWVLLGFVGSNQVELETTKAKRKIQTASCHLRHTHKESLQNAIKRITKAKYNGQ